MLKGNHNSLLLFYNITYLLMWKNMKHNNPKSGILCIQIINNYTFQWKIHMCSSHNFLTAFESKVKKIINNIYS